MKNIFLNLAMLLPLVFVNCNSDEHKEEFIPVEIQYELIAQEQSGAGFIDNTDNFINLVVSNVAEWSELKSKIWVLNEVPEIDFNNNLVIVCIDKVRPETGYDMNILSIIEYENKIVVDVDCFDNGIHTMLPGRAWIAVKIPKSNKEIAFE